MKEDKGREQIHITHICKFLNSAGPVEICSECSGSERFLLQAFSKPG